MDGLTLLRELAALEHDTKAIVVSAYSDMPNIRRAMQLGAIDFVTKPIDMSDLVASVTETAALTRRLKLTRSLELQKAHLEAYRDALTTFLKIAAHDLRDPMAAIAWGSACWRTSMMHWPGTRWKSFAVPSNGLRPCLSPT